MLEEELLDYISERAHVERTALGADTRLFSNGFLDSIAVLDVAAFIEQRSGVRFEVTEISLDNLDSVGRIMDFVRSKTAR